MIIATRCKTFNRFISTSNKCVHTKQGDKMATFAEPKLAVYWHPACVVHKIPSHPEQPGRVSSILHSLRDNFPTASFRESNRATEEQVLNAHHVSLWRSLQNNFQKTKDKKAKTQETVYEYIDGDTVIMHGTEEAVLRAAGAAVQAVDDLYSTSNDNSGNHTDDGDNNRTDIAFCCVRPPGHHAEPFRSMGFCFVNNTVVAAEHARLKYNIQRVAILDFDVHHGNGTNEYARLLFRHYEKARQDAAGAEVKKEKEAEPSVFSGSFGAKKLTTNNGNSLYNSHDFLKFADILQHQHQYQQQFTVDSHCTPALYPLFYASTHEREGYPGTGAEVPILKRSEIDRFIVNRNIPSGPHSREIFRLKWLEILEELVAYDPELVIFSAGFDAHDDDPLADVELQDEDFYWVTQVVLHRLYHNSHSHSSNSNHSTANSHTNSLNTNGNNSGVEKKSTQDSTNDNGSNSINTTTTTTTTSNSKKKTLKVMSVLEGGYDLDAIARCAVQHVQAMVDVHNSFSSAANNGHGTNNGTGNGGTSTINADGTGKYAEILAEIDNHSANNSDKTNMKNETFKGDEIAALQQTLSELGIQPPKSKSNTRDTTDNSADNSNSNGTIASINDNTTNTNIAISDNASNNVDGSDDTSSNNDK